MRLTLVGSLPPSTLPLNEHTAYMAHALNAVPDVELTVVADVVTGPETDDVSGINVRRCWRHNDLFSYVRAWRVILGTRPGVVWFNLVLTSFADQPVQAFISMMLPLLVKVSSRARVVVTLHAPVESIDLAITKHRKFRRLKLFFAKLAQGFLLRSDVVFVFLDRYVQLLSEGYARQNVFRSHHGVEDGQLATIAPGDGRNVLIFGRFGGYKNLEFAMATIADLAKKNSDLRFTIAGSDHPSYPGYYLDVQQRYAGLSNVTFRGYVPEVEMEALFRAHALVWLPYDSNTGVSGVAHRACRYGVPILMPDLPDFVSMLHEDGFAAALYRTKDIRNAQEQLTKLIDDRSWRMTLAGVNVEGARRLSTQRIVEGNIELLRKKFDKAS